VRGVDGSYGEEPKRSWLRLERGLKRGRIAVMRKEEGGSGRAFTPDQRLRYSRHFLLGEVGEEGQAKLLASKVFLVGAGGLGSPVALYLAAAGVGTLGVVDGDAVELSNLQRQILHHTGRLGKPKVDSAQETLGLLNPDVRVVPYGTRLTSDNALSMIGEYDVAVDASDNFPTRYLMNDACFMAGKPWVHGSVYQFEGQVSVFLPGRGPCYRCLFPSPHPVGMVPSASEVGILGVVPGVVGAIQATEVVKLLLGKGDPAVGRLLLYDSLAMQLREVNVRRNPECPLCGDNPTVTELLDYEAFCYREGSR